MTITRSDIGKQIMKTPPKPKKKPMTPKEAKALQDSMTSAGRAGRGDDAIRKNSYKCGGKVKGSSKKK